jgi:hypothetical protein
MPKATRVHSTPRRTASKIKAKKLAKPASAESAPAKRSEIIEQSMIYVQCLAAHDAAYYGRRHRRF